MPTQDPSREDPIESFADDPGLLWIKGFGLNPQDSPFEWTLYDGTTFIFSAQSLQDQGGEVFNQGRVYELKGWEVPPTVLTLNQQELSFVLSYQELLEFPSSAWYDPQAQTLRIHHQESSANLEWAF